MKRLAIIAVMVLMGLTASASSIHYFTHSQAVRTVEHLGRQNEMMIYCGYDYEIETYVLINEVWMERVNSSYYEIWVYGYDAYTGDEIYMPLDLQCVWLYSAGQMYNAAQYLRFHATVHVPTIRWYVPPYNPFTRVVHRTGYVRSYHYDIHRRGWMPPAPPVHGYGPAHQPPLPPYYMRTPQSPAPAPTTRWTPGSDRPKVSAAPSHSGGSSSRPTTGNNVAPAPSRNSGAATSPSRSGSTRTTTTTTSPSRSSSGTATTTTTSPSRSGSGTTTTTTTSPSRTSSTPASKTMSSPSRASSAPAAKTTTSPSRTSSTPAAKTTASPSRTTSSSRGTSTQRTTSPSRR